MTERDIAPIEPTLVLTRGSLIPLVVAQEAQASGTPIVEEPLPLPEPMPMPEVASYEAWGPQA